MSHIGVRHATHINCVIAHKCKSHVSGMNESWHPCECVMPHACIVPKKLLWVLLCLFARMGHGTRINVSRYSFEWAPSVTWMRHDTHITVSCRTHMTVSCHTPITVLCHTHMTVSCVTHETRRRLIQMSHVSDTHTSYRIYQWVMSYEWVMAHIWMSHGTWVTCHVSDTHMSDCIYQWVMSYIGLLCRILSLL